MPQPTTANWCRHGFLPGHCLAEACEHAPKPKPAIPDEAHAAFMCEAKLRRQREAAAKRTRPLSRGKPSAASTRARTSRQTCAKCSRHIAVDKGDGSLCFYHWRRAPEHIRHPVAAAPEAPQLATKALELVDAIGWDLARAIAARVERLEEQHRSPTP